MEQITLLLDAMREWTSARPDVIGFALVGSYARGAARPDSDVDVVIVTTDPQSYRDAGEWLSQIAWPHGRRPGPTWEDVGYGMVWSRRVVLEDGTIVEIGFAPETWTATEPLDPGTESVVERGFVILSDPRGLLRRLFDAVLASTVRRSMPND